MPATIAFGQPQFEIAFYHHTALVVSCCLPWRGHFRNKQLFVTSLITMGDRPCDCESPQPVDALRGGECSASRVAIGDCLSATMSCMQFNTYTRCHSVCVSVEDVDFLWADTITFVASDIANCGCASPLALAARAPIVGAFVERLSSSQFSIGLITQRSECEHVLQLVRRWCSACGLEFMSVTPFLELPMCRPQRRVTMKVWVEQTDKHVTASELLPRIHVAISQKRSSCASQDSSAPRAHVAVKLFSPRAADVVLRGDLQVMLAEPNAASRSSSTSSSIGGPASAPHKCYTLHSDHREVLAFDNVMVATPGETLIGVECVVRPEYRPFVLPLTGLIPPFLVVGDE